MREVGFAEISLAFEVATDLTLSILLAEMMATLEGSSQLKSQESSWAFVQVLEPFESFVHVLAMFRKVTCCLAKMIVVCVRTMSGMNPRSAPKMLVHQEHSPVERANVGYDQPCMISIFPASRSIDFVASGQQ